MPEIGNIQEHFYNESVDYRHGSPHLSFLHLYDKLIAIVLRQLDYLVEVDLPLDVLELGAGHGGYTEPVLAAGCRVTAVEMSAPSQQYLEKRFGYNEAFSTIYDAAGLLEEVSRTYSLILCVSVLHHIPDYMETLRKLMDRLSPGGVIVTLQDPLWYPTTNKWALWLNTIGYAFWRSRQGSVRRGISTRLRRIRRTYDESNPADMVEYHVVRQGVNQKEILKTLGEQFAEVELISYWTNQSAVVQRLGEKLGLINTFGIVLKGYGMTAKG
jgi:SAM-dependent methyltransferase